jgi:DNA topoisomerase VI subunit A
VRGQPPRGCRRLLQRLNKELGLPIICVLDDDPWGHYIYSVIKQGSISLAFESDAPRHPRREVPRHPREGLQANAASTTP